MQAATGVAGPEFPVGGGRFRHQRIGITQADNGVNQRVDRSDAIEKGLHDSLAGQAAGVRQSRRRVLWRKDP